MNVIELMERLQNALQMTDVELAWYLHSDPSTIRHVRAGEAELPAHASLVLLDRLGFLKISDVTLAILPQRGREKVKEAIRRQAISLAQQFALKELQKELKREKAKKK
jgi:hypothetical protein